MLHLDRSISRRLRFVFSVLVCVGSPFLLVAAAGSDEYARLRQEMVKTQIEARGVRQSQVLAAMRTVPRHRFVPEPLREHAYEDRPLSIGSGQTISQPYIVALMCELLELDGSEKVLEIGTGSGYHAAILSRLARAVHTIEIIPPLGERAGDLLHELGYENVEVHIGDGYRGWPEAAPFDAIILTAAPPEIPPPLFDQLREGGLLVAPVGRGVQDLELYSKTADGMTKRTVLPVVFVPMTGEAQSRRR